MIKNYFKIAFRNLAKYKFISFINLFGLTVGITCCLLITTYILNELSYDRYNEKAGDIYRVTRSFNNADGVVSLKLSTVSPPFGYYMPTDFPEIKKMTRLLEGGIVPLRYKEKRINEKNVSFADDQVFDVFSIKVLKGNPKTALTAPFTAILTEEVARRYFGDEDPLNKTLRWNNQFDLKVTGIYKAFPPNAHMHPEMLISFSTLKDRDVYGEESLRTNWGNNSFFTYLLLPPGYNPQSMVSRFPAFVDKRMTGEEYGGGQPSKFTKLDLQKLTDIHLYSHTDYEAEPNGDIKRVYIFAAIALFILLIACINYMNLSTARSALRGREIGIRKVMGAGKNELVLQFLSESVLLTWIAIIFAIGLLYATLPFLNELSGQALSVKILLRWQVLVPVLLAPFAIGIIAGLYPALFMSSFQPVKTLKGLFKAGGSSISFRKVLVVAQFAISIILIITTAVVFQQLNYMQQKSLGFEKDHIVTMAYPSELNDKFDAFRNQLLANAGFKDVARSSRIPTGRLLDAMGAAASSSDTMADVKTDIKYLAVDYNFIPAYNISLAAGRNFSKHFGTDTLNYVLNESAVKAVGWKTSKDAIGQRFRYGGVTGQVIGVIKDFHFESMHQEIVPIVMRVFPPSQNSYNNTTVKFSGQNVQASLAYLEQTWSKFLPESPFEYTFLDENFNALYQAEQRQGTIFTVFSCIAIFIACLGLFGLSAFTITQRIKEIGVRKVLGANVRSIVALLSKDFLLLVLIAAIIAFPLAWYAMHSWLQDFAYRVNIAWWIFVIAAIAALAVALLTVGFQAMKAAVANPVKSLRTE